MKLKRFVLKGSQPESGWRFASFIEVDREYKVEGHNIWNHYWHCNDRKVEVKCPMEGQVYFFKQYQIQTPSNNIDFVAGEFSDGRLGIYVKEDF